MNRIDTMIAIFSFEEKGNFDLFQGPKLEVVWNNQYQDKGLTGILNGLRGIQFNVRLEIEI